ncbi:phage head-tail joining protein [Burkholderia gladioli]|uniref:GpW family protein n=1 Tax=Burkholderia gladioli (strain BSR3) TaxID=999541 RepID=F2L9K4_BURGS|nr:hypothetical protein [Burkholderia gladioli]AEA59767.1 hypothetical protein bgla_1g10840 [Burkholderia gladioli BSR3]MBW5284452.1 hypothetical protein [Burkholderia gladioli]
MAFTQGQLTAIEAALASGTLTVEYNGKRVTYQTVSELMRVRDLIKSDLEQQSPSGVPRSSVGIYKRY